MATAWRLERRTGTSQQLHDLDLELGSEPAAAQAEHLVRWNEVEDRSLAIGSAQPIHSIDPIGLSGAGLVVTRRRSGGGAVLLEPGRQVWIDVFLPADDDRWVDDVGRSAWWLGEAWAMALDALRPGLASRLEVQRGPSSDPVAGRVACFASTGPGEVTLDGRKLVGISQRRTRHWARFQSVVYLDWDPTPLLDALEPTGLSDTGRRALIDVADLRAAGITGADLPDTSGEPGWSVVESLHRLLA